MAGESQDEFTSVIGQSFNFYGIFAEILILCWLKHRLKERKRSKFSSAKYIY